MDGTTAALILDGTPAAGVGFRFLSKKRHWIGTEKRGREIHFAIVVVVVAVSAHPQVGNVQHFANATQWIFPLNMSHQQDCYRCYGNGSSHDCVLSCFIGRVGIVWN